MGLSNLDRRWWGSLIVVTRGSDASNPVTAASTSAILNRLPTSQGASTRFTLAFSVMIVTTIRTRNDSPATHTDVTIAT
jgi:hypothetical protein